MLPSGFTDRTGSSSGDTLISSNQEVVFGLGGSDTLYHGGGTSWLVGGSGGDTYRIAGYGVAGIYDAGGSSNDHFYDSSYVIGQSYAIQLDGKHLMAFDSYGNSVIFFEWKSAQHKIEYFHVNGAVYTNDQFSVVIFSSPYYLGNYAADAVLPGGTALIDATLAELSSRVSTYESGSTTTAPATAAVSGTSGNDAMAGTTGNDTIFGLAGNDTITVGSGNDVIYGNQGLDSLDGGDGDDVLFGGQNGGTAGSDGVLRSGVDTVIGGNGNDQIYGNHGGDLLSGGAGNDTIFGGQDSDTIFGGDGGERLIGGAGVDILRGGGGADVFVFSATSHSPSLSFADSIADFSYTDGDLIDLSGIDANVGLSGDQSFSWLGYSEIGAGYSVWWNTSSVSASSSESWTYIYASTNGDAVAEIVILIPATNLLSIDFLL